MRRGLTEMVSGYAVEDMADDWRKRQKQGTAERHWGQGDAPPTAGAAALSPSVPS